MNITATRYHDFSAGHRVYGHEGKCAGLHGHNYRVHFTIESRGGDDEPLDTVGRVLDFSVIKSLLCQWLETNWDHNFLSWEVDPLFEQLDDLLNKLAVHGYADGINAKEREAYGSLVCVPFNPTAENMAAYLLNVIGPRVLPSSVRLISVRIDETRKCSAEASL